MKNNESPEFNSFMDKVREEDIKNLIHALRIDFDELPSKGFVTNYGIYEARVRNKEF